MVAPAPAAMQGLYVVATNNKSVPPSHHHDEHHSTIEAMQKPTMWAGLHLSRAMVFWGSEQNYEIMYPFPQIG